MRYGIWLRPGMATSEEFQGIFNWPEDAPQLESICCFSTSIKCFGRSDSLVLRVDTMSLSNNQRSVSQGLREC